MLIIKNNDFLTDFKIHFIVFKYFNLSASTVSDLLSYIFKKPF